MKLPRNGIKRVLLQQNIPPLKARESYFYSVKFVWHVSNTKLTLSLTLRALPTFTQTSSFENNRRAKNGPYHIKYAGHRRAICGNVAAKRGDACLLFGGYTGHLWPVQTHAKMVSLHYVNNKDLV